MEFRGNVFGGKNIHDIKKTTMKKNEEKHTHTHKKATLKQNNMRPDGEAEGLGTGRRRCCLPILGAFPAHGRLRQAGQACGGGGLVPRGRLGGRH